MDLLNHGVDFNAFYDYLPDVEEFQLTSRFKIEVGQELLITYGRKKSDHLLLSVRH